MEGPTSEQLLATAHDGDISEVHEDGSVEMDARPTIREAKWMEIRKYIDYMRRFAYSEGSQMDLSKEHFFDLYNMSVHLLRAIDSLDPDKSHMPPYPFRREYMMGSSTHPTVVSPQGTPSSDSGSPYDSYYRAPYLGYGPSETSFETKKRKSSVNAAKRNLVCQMCGVTKTPEWRRGPSGDHTLCNACGLQYAKTVKKQKKDTDPQDNSKQPSQSGDKIDTIPSIMPISPQLPIQQNSNYQPIQTIQSIQNHQSYTGMTLPGLSHITDTNVQ